jgi:hypothetical protein
MIAKTISSPFGAPERRRPTHFKLFLFSKYRKWLPRRTTGGHLEDLFLIMTVRHNTEMQVLSHYFFIDDRQLFHVFNSADVIGL